jgi:hypothetical protein
MKKKPELMSFRKAIAQMLKGKKIRRWCSGIACTPALYNPHWRSPEVSVATAIKKIKEEIKDHCLKTTLDDIEENDWYVVQE